MVEIAERSGQPARMDLDRDIVMGHEFCAEILDHGPGTQKTLKTGTRVCSMPLLVGADGIEGVGYSNRVPGGYAERMVLSELMLLGKSVQQAAADGDVDVQGDPDAADRLLNLFRLPGTEPVAALAVS